ncbi:uncharacterized protein VTP21DRAFT_1420 [Calcarisporiella thermophila]|uniref:uncharacterized protein n=1 Tax=Calcarisporiella thermophila TaxID=911321 RepID=UPI00374461F4
MSHYRRLTVGGQLRLDSFWNIKRSSDELEPATHVNISSQIQKDNNAGVKRYTWSQPPARIDSHFRQSKHFFSKEEPTPSLKMVRTPPTFRRSYSLVDEYSSPSSPLDEPHEESLLSPQRKPPRAFGLRNVYEDEDIFEEEEEEEIEEEIEEIAEDEEKQQPYMEEDEDMTMLVEEYAETSLDDYGGADTSFNTTIDTSFNLDTSFTTSGCTSLSANHANNSILSQSCPTTSPLQLQQWRRPERIAEATPPWRIQNQMLCAPPTTALRRGAAGTTYGYVTARDENISPASQRIMQAVSMKCVGIGAGEWALMRERGVMENPFL